MKILINHQSPKILKILKVTIAIFILYLLKVFCQYFELFIYIVLGGDN
jgi:hypothetical protein